MQTRIRRALLFIIVSSVLIPAAADEWPEPYESYFYYIAQYPSNANPGWHEDVQGIAHDEGHWFITQTAELWKIPVTQDLGSVSTSDPGVFKKYLSDYDPELSGWDHCGDLDCHEFAGQHFLVVPLEPVPAIAIFENNNSLDLLGVDLATGASQAPWCAVHPVSGQIYLSNFDDSSSPFLFVFDVQWSQASQGNVSLQQQDPLYLYDETGAPLYLEGAQGGEFSESGDLLFIVTGYHEFEEEVCAIHVLDVATGMRIKMSENTEGYYGFYYQVDPGDLTGEEPEGLTIWDLDDANAPSIRGQLHVLMLDNDWPDDDDVYLKHYTNTFHVDGSYSGDEHGTVDEPFDTVGEALTLAWHGSRIKIEGGSYPEALSFSKQIQLCAKGGTVTVGIGGQFGLTPSGAINLSKTSQLVLY